MSNDLNRCEFIGRLGKDPEERYLPDGKAVCNISIACGWKSKDKEGVEWVKITAFGKLAEIMNKYLKKGSQVFIAGRMTTRKWQDQSGQDRYTTEIVADQMQMLDSRNADNAPPASAPQAPMGGGFDGDIPF